MVECGTWIDVRCSMSCSTRVRVILTYGTDSTGLEEEAFYFEFMKSYD